MTDSPTLFERALAYAKGKDFASARRVLAELLRQDPDHLNGWLLAAHVVSSPREAAGCYRRVLRLQPDHAYAREQLARLEGAASPTPAAPPPERVQAPPKPRNWTVLGASLLLGLSCLVLLVLLLFFPGSFKLGSRQPTPTSDQLFNVLYQNARAANREDLAGYMATIHPASRAYESTEATLADMFANYDLEFIFYDLELSSLNSSRAEVHFVLSTRKLAGGDFRDNVVIGTMILRPDGEVWKIYDQEVEDVQYP